jgi:hypothetical protein
MWLVETKPRQKETGSTGRGRKKVLLRSLVNMAGHSEGWSETKLPVEWRQVLTRVKTNHCVDGCISFQPLVEPVH